VQKRFDENPHAMRARGETAKHPFGTMKMRMGATHFLMKTLPKVATEMALCVLTYNLTRVMKHRRCARGTRSDQGIGLGTPIVTRTRDVHEAAQDRSEGRLGCPLKIFYNWISPATLAGAYTSGCPLHTTKTRNSLASGRSGRF
jgi:hypothetical protein